MFEIWTKLYKKSRIRETTNLSTDADSRINIFVCAGVQKAADRIFFGKNMDILISNLLAESIFDFGEWSN